MCVAVLICGLSGELDATVAPRYVLLGQQDTLQKVLDAVVRESKGEGEYRLWVETEGEEKEKVWNLVEERVLNVEIRELEIEQSFRILVDEKNGESWRREIAEVDWRSTLKVGSVVDALDKMNKWYESTIKEIKEGKAFVVGCSSDLFCLVIFFILAL